MSPDEKANMNVKASNRMKTFRLGMSLDEKANVNMKASNRMKTLRLGVSPGEKIRRRKKNTMERMRLREQTPQKSSGNDMNCGKEALKFLHRIQNAKKNITNINLLCV
jgi:hypothetical protein